MALTACSDKILLVVIEGKKCSGADIFVQKGSTLRSKILNQCVTSYPYLWKELKCCEYSRTTTLRLVCGCGPIPDLSLPFQKLVKCINFMALNESGLSLDPDAPLPGRPSLNVLLWNRRVSSTLLSWLTIPYSRTFINYLSRHLCGNFRKCVWNSMALYSFFYMNMMLFLREIKFGLAFAICPTRKKSTFDSFKLNSKWNG